MAKKTGVVKGFKGFNQDLKCRGFQYEIGGEYETKDKPVKCTERGFHMCEEPLDVFSFYPPTNSRYCEVEGSGDVARDNCDSKIAVQKIKIGAEIGIQALIRAAVDIRFKRVKWSKQASATGVRGAASATGYQGAASATGIRGAASATGYQGAASATGYQGAASATGYQGAASATGYQGAASATGDEGATSATGIRGAASATGIRGAASATGDEGAASATGYQGAASATGYQGAASVKGKHSIACGLGIESKAKGKLTDWLVLAEWHCIDGEWQIKNVKTASVDGECIKENTWYTLKDGEFVEVSD
ncbi:MAG: hypothetical protein M1548_08580 [Actinobacteria bacterium]|nr:hypothetical protein [Actinomycetota bacterium]